MPPLEEVSLNQKAVLWRAGPPDRYGTPQVYPPVEVDVNWTEKSGEAPGAEGGTDPADGTVLVDASVAVGSLLWLGRLEEWSPASPEAATGLMRVVGWSLTHDIKGRHRSLQLNVKRYAGTLPAIIST